MSKINLGDMVMVVGPHEQPSSGDLLANKIGIVRHFDYQNRIGVEFSHNFRGHNLNGSILSTRGWYISPDSLVKLEPVKEVIKKFILAR